VKNESFIEELLAGDATEGLMKAWASPQLSLAEKARTVSTLHMRSRMSLEGSARMTGATPAQIQALLELATLEDDDLDLVSAADPPATTWFLFAAADSESIKAGLEALRIQEPTTEHALVAIYNAMRSVSGPSQDERIAAISGPTLGYLAKKAKQYDVLSTKSRSFMVSLSQRKAKGLELTARQLPWLKNNLLELVQARVVTRHSPDGDQEACDEVLDALGV